MQVACFWSPPSESLLALLQGAPLEAKVALVAVRTSVSLTTDTDILAPSLAVSPEDVCFYCFSFLRAERDAVARRRVERLFASEEKDAACSRLEKPGTRRVSYIFSSSLFYERESWASPSIFR